MSTIWAIVTLTSDNPISMLNSLEKQHGLPTTKVNGVPAYLASTSQDRFRLLYRVPRDAAGTSKSRTDNSIGAEIRLTAFSGSVNLSEFGFIGVDGSPIGSSALAGAPLLPRQIINALR